MKVSESWLREHVDVDVSTEELVEQLTMAGLEVDGLESAAAEFSGVIVGEIVAVEPHPNADKLRVCTVRGSENASVQVVCGAPNVRLGAKVPFATVGAILPGDFAIKKASLRGVESFGMLCAAAELGLSEDNEGLFELPETAEVGADLREFLQLNDKVIEVDLTPNRGDCLSILGLSREIAVINDTVTNWPEIESIRKKSSAPASHIIDSTFPVTLTATESCPRYVGRVIQGINPKAETPLWMLEKLRRSGIRGIHPVVDITNYVMLELGQPMHAFDLERLQEGVEVRFAKAGETIRMLDGSDLMLDSETLVVADAKQVLALAGIMGGEDSGVSEETSDIFLESAYFNPLTIAGKARHYGLHTDSSHRFERGVDTELSSIAMERATQLLCEIVGGKAGPLVISESKKHLPPEKHVSLRSAQLNRLLKMDIDTTLTLNILQRLGLQLLDSAEEGEDEARVSSQEHNLSWMFKIPSWRFDLAIEADLIEEIARIYGYNRLPESQLSFSAEIKSLLPRPLNSARAVLVSRGYQEAITYSFVAPEIQQLINPGQEAVIIANPISADMAVMRTSLWPGLLTSLKYNLNRQQNRVRLFEGGLRFNGINSGQQSPTIAGVISGPRAGESWNQGNEEVDFYDIKGDVEAMLSSLGILDQVEMSPGELETLHPGQTAEIKLSGKTIGFVGKLNPIVENSLGLSQAAYLFELYLERFSGNSTPLFAPISRFPEVRRDIAILVDRDISVAELTALVRNNSSEYLTQLKVFDVYVGKGVDKHSKSVALGLTFQGKSRTLEDIEINNIEETVIKALVDQFGAERR